MIEENERGSDFVERVVRGYKEVLARAAGVEYLGEYIEGYFKVLNVEQYESGGETHIVLRINSTTAPYVEATANDLNRTAWYELLFTKPNDVVYLKAVKIDNIWIIVEFDNLNIP